MKYQPRTKPRAHQVEAAKRLAANRVRFAILAEMGTGKSKMICDEFGEREFSGDLHDLLIIAPAGSYRNWDTDKSETQQSQFKAHMSEDLYHRLHHFALESGNKTKTYKLHLTDFMRIRDHPRALLVNVEALSTVKTSFEICQEFLGTKHRRAMMIVDESTTIRGRDSSRTEKVLQLGTLADSRRILTGLVTPNSPLDLYSQFEFLDWNILGHKSFYSFRARYAVMQPVPINPFALREIRNKQAAARGKKRPKKVRPIMAVVGYTNAEELQRKIAPVSYRVLKEDCLDLPPKIYLRREVKLTEEQQRIYAEMKEFCTAELDNMAYVTATEVITRLLRLHQIVCGYAVDEQGEEHDIPSNRISELQQLLAEHAGKAIIWVAYHHSVRTIIAALTEEYGEEAVAQFHGKNKATRDEEERRFLNNKACRFMVATRAGGLGNTWIEPSLVVYYANDYDLEHRMQSEDRTHRDGLTHSVTYVDLVAEKTVDETILKALRRKINMSTTINGENFREWLI